MQRRSTVPKILLQSEERLSEQARQSSDSRCCEVPEVKKRDPHIHQLILSIAQDIPEESLLWKFPTGIDAFSYRKDKEAEVIFNKHRAPLHNDVSEVWSFKRYREALGQDRLSGDSTYMRKGSRMSSFTARSPTRGSLYIPVPTSSKSTTTIPSVTTLAEDVLSARVPTSKELPRIKFKLPRVLSRQGVLEPIPWFLERLSESCRSCRFGLPMDMRMFERMTISQYLLGYCHIPLNRFIVYRKCYRKHKPKYNDLLPMQIIETALQDILSNSVSKKDIATLFKALDITSATKMDLTLFSAVCAVAERILYVSYACIYNTIDVARGNLEYADFSALKWKLEGIKIDPFLRRLLMSLG
ncbi:unnamed protein product [Lymnaea stagnalis]|uniref:EF-hand domain-containing protein n=1 Tax=Lymnaea stagnalis TaxID=6523 RepID=A0AAV2IHV1_LYMST